MAQILRFTREPRNNLFSDKGRGASNRAERSGSISDILALRAGPDGMKLIPWGDIWSSLKLAKMRGNGEMIKVFYDTLFDEAVFDDRGAWSLDVRKRN